MSERWKPVVGFEGAYEVSNFGRVRSLDRYVSQRTKWGGVSTSLKHGQLIRPGPVNSGYVQMHFHRDGHQTSKLLHAVVLEAFVGPRPEQAEGMHLDHDRRNNHLSNLAWGTRRENEDQKKAAGRVPKGEISPTSKLTERDVREIRKSIGIPQQELADRYGCTFSNISAIQLRKSWRHVV